MQTPTLAADILAGVIALAVPLTGPLEHRIYRSDPKTPLKLLTYGVNVVLLWGLAIAALWIDGLGRLLQSPAAGEAWLWAPAVSSTVLSIAAGLYFLIGILPLIQSMRGLRWRRAYATALRRTFSDIPGFLPTTAAERLAWIPLSLTAGVCEEVFSRGFLIRFLHESGLGLSVAAALVVSSLLFGLAHAYQGFRGVLGTTIGGLALGLLFLLTGSLIPSILLHVLIDLQIAYIMRPIAPETAAAPETA